MHSSVDGKTSDCGILKGGEGNMKKNDGNILNKRGPKEKIAFGIVLSVFVLYALSLIAPFVSLIFNSLKEGMEYGIFNK